MDKKPDPIQHLFERANQLVDRLEDIFPASNPQIDLDTIAWRWRRFGQRTELKPIKRIHNIQLSDLQCIDRQLESLKQNTRQFISGKPANNALLWGSRGTGKSSLIKAMLNTYAGQGLRMIEIDKHDLVDLPDIIELIWGREERFIVYSDDLSFEASDPGYKSLKAALDGSIGALPDNMLVYATSNRRHLLPEYMQENLDTEIVDGEIHHSDATEEKISLSERFGIWLSFYPFHQDEYLKVVDYWLEHFGCNNTQDEAIRKDALRWALSRGSRSGRVAHQFARDLAGKLA